MKCEIVEGLLSAYHDSALDAPLQREVADHLQTCAQCSAVLTDYERFDALLTDLPRAEPGPELHDRIFSAPEYLALLRERDREQTHDTDHPTVPAVAVNAPRRTTPPWRRALIPAAAALLLAMGGGLLAHNGFRASSSGPTSQHGLPAYGNPGSTGVPLAAGNRVVYLRNGRLWSAAETGNQPTQALTPAGEQVVAWATSPTVSSGGATLVAYVDAHGTLSVIRADGQSNQVVFRPGADGQPGPGFWSTALGAEVRATLRWSPDGQQIAYLVLTGNGQTALSIFGAGPSGTAHTATSGPVTTGVTVGNISWAPDSSHIAYTETSASGTSLWVYDQSTQGVTEVTSLLDPGAPGAQMGQVAWTGDAHRLGLTWSAVNGGGVVAISTWSTGDQVPTRLYAASTSSAVAAYSADAGQWLVGDDTRLLTISPASGTIGDAATLAAPASAILWNAQGTDAAVLSWDSLAIWTAGTPLTLVGTGVTPTVAIAWAPGGQSLAYATTSGVDIARVSDQNGAWTTAAYATAGPRVMSLAWAPDGQGLAVARANGVMVLSGSGTARLVDSAQADNGMLVWTVAG